MESKKSLKNYWIKSGLVWGAVMFLIMQVAYPLINSEEITLKSILVGVVLWSIGGLSFGFAMRRITRKDS